MQHLQQTGRRAHRVVAGIGVLAVASFGFAPEARSATQPPALGGLTRTNATVDIVHYVFGPAYDYYDGDLGIWVDAPTSGSFEVRMTRRYGSSPHLDLVRRSGASSTLERLPDSLVGDWTGLSKFFDVTVRDSTGTTIGTTSSDFCPNNYLHARTSRFGPMDPIYPTVCGGSVWVAGVVMGIERGWSTPALSLGDLKDKNGASVTLADGRYDIRVSIRPAWRSALSLTDRTSVDLTANVRTEIVTCEPFCPVDRNQRTNHRSSAAPTGLHTTNSRTARRTPTRTEQRVEVTPNTMPDLAALPAWGISTGTTTNPDGSTSDLLGFGATVWNAGPGQLVVEGFRRPDQTVMDSYQYFYNAGTPVATRYVGQMEYDPRVGHHHWHFRDFATYELTGADRTSVQRSGKEAFCLAPTDLIDVTRPSSTYRPGSTGLGSACGDISSRWIREVLPTGWGDTYTQGVAGQAFDVTGLPNGVYYIKVTANPLQRLIERSAQNNVSFRGIVLGGKPGSRTVKVAPWRGIDTEQGRTEG